MDLPVCWQTTIFSDTRTSFTVSKYLFILNSQIVINIIHSNLLFIIFNLCVYNNKMIKQTSLKTLKHNKIEDLQILKYNSLKVCDV